MHEHHEVLEARYANLADENVKAIPSAKVGRGAVTGGSDTTSTQWNAIMKTKTCVWQGCHVTSSTPGSPGWVYYTEIVAPIAPEGLYCPVHSAWIETQAYGDWEEIQGSRMRSLQ
jgi:hypothetical protein